MKPSYADTITTLERDAQKFVALAAQLVSDNKELQAKVQKTKDQLSDAMDEIALLRRQVADRDQLLEEMRDVASRRGRK